MSLASARIAARLVAVAALAALTAGCFQPMYAEHADGTGLRDKLLTVDLPPVDKPNASREARVGVAIRNALAFKLYGTATEITDGDERERYCQALFAKIGWRPEVDALDLWTVDIAHAAWQIFGDGTQHAITWTAGAAPTVVK